MFLHIKLVKSVNIRLWPDLSFQIRQNPAPSGLEKINPVQPYFNHAALENQPTKNMHKHKHRKQIDNHSLTH